MSISLVIIFQSGRIFSISENVRDFGHFLLKIIYCFKSCTFEKQKLKFNVFSVLMPRPKLVVGGGDCHLKKTIKIFLSAWGGKLSN